jgi:hypothetical protein
MAGATALSQLPVTWAGDVGITTADFGAVAALSAGPTFAWRIPFDNAATATITVSLPYQWRVLDVIVAKRGGNGGASNTLQLKQGSHDCSDAIDTNITNGALARAASLFETYDVVDPDADLSVINTRSAGNSSMLVTIIGMRIG